MSTLFYLRLVVAAIFIYHSVPKLKNPQAMAGGMGWSSGRVIALGLVEFIASLGVLGGIAIRFSAFLMMAVMVGAIYHKIIKWKVPFVSLKGTGWELDILLFAACLTIFLRF